MTRTEMLREIAGRIDPPAPRTPGQDRGRRAHGLGKTTLADELAARLAGRGDR